MSTQTLEPRLVTGLFATYYSEVGGNTVVLTGNRGDVIEVSESEAARLDKLGSTVAVDDAALDASQRNAALVRYRALRGDAEAAEAVARAIAPTDAIVDVSVPQSSVSPPSLGAEPVGDLLTGDTGGPHTPAPDTGSGPQIVRADAPDVAEASVAELSAWIESESPNVGDTVALAEGEPALAAKVLEAEQAATGGDPRKGVEDALTKIIDAE